MNRCSMCHCFFLSFTVERSVVGHCCSKKSIRQGDFRLQLKGLESGSMSQAVSEDIQVRMYTGYEK